jgi:predicted permease
MTDNERSSTSFSTDALKAVGEAVAGRAQVFGFAELYQVNFAAGPEPRVASGQMVSGSYYAALGLRAAAGRLLGPADDRPEAEPVAVLSHAFWRRLGGQADLVGRVVRINGVPTTVVGVAPPGFNGTRQVGDTSDVTVALALRERFVRPPSDQLAPNDPRWWWVIVMARLAPGVEAGAVQPAIERAVASTLPAADEPPAPEEPPFRVELLSGARGMTEARAGLVQPVVLMAAIVALVVLIACANLANLLLARSAARDQEVAVRLALGAARAHVVRQRLLESLLLGAGAAASGLLAARFIAIGLLPALGLEPEALALAPGWRLAAFAAGAAVGSALLFGLVPAWRGADVAPGRALRAAGGGRGGPVPRLRLARGLLVAQVALSVVVLMAAGLLAATLRNLERVDPGFEPGGVLTFRVDPTLNGYDAARIRALYAELLERLRALPGVESASFSQNGLLWGWSSTTTIEELDGRVLEPPMDLTRLIVDRDFFATVGMPLLAGPGFSGMEEESARRSLVVNQEFARRAFGGEAPVGRAFRLSDRPSSPTYEIVGVVRDARVTRLHEPPPPTAYFSYRQEVTYGAVFAVRAAGDPRRLGEAVRRAVGAVDPDLPVDRLRTQEEQVALSLRRERLFARLAVWLAALALALACVGLYGLLAYSVTRRTAEIGVRMALGAERRRVLLMVVGEAGRLMAVGLVLGAGAALVCGRGLESRLFGLTPADPWTLLLAVAILAGVALAAAYLPARRAARVDPLVALKYE